jgi:acetyl-CoA synthetase
MPLITKQAVPGAPPPRLADYAETCRGFSWQAARAELDGLPDGAGLNIAYEAVDRHVRAGRGDAPALRCIDAAGRVEELSYAELGRAGSRFANVLDALGLEPGGAVFTLLGRSPALFTVALGTWKHRSLFCALFSAFGPEPIQTRMAIGGAGVLVTTAALYARKVAPLRAALPALRHVLIVDAQDAPLPEGTHDLQRLLDAADAEFVIGPTDPATPALLHFTSGTTGRPKGAVHVHEAVVAHQASARFALDLGPQDVFWCTADPGWVTGISYGVIAPLTIGASLVVDTAEFDTQRWLGILQDLRVNVWYTAPTAVRMMMRLGAEPIRGHDFSALRLLASVGEPLSPDAVRWGEQAFGLPLHDNWWQTETGAIMVANFRALDIKPGSMGRPLPGVEAAVVRRRPDGGVDLLGDAQEGELALKSGWPSMFRAYLGEPERYRKCFAGEWYLSGDLVRRDADGYFWFVGRADDVIKSAGHLIGPFEVESALLEHPAVAEAGVIGKPDPTVGEVVKAFVVVRPGHAADEALRRALLAHARTRLGAAIAPREIAFCDHLPLTRSGKIMRRLLRARELGLPEGDTSTLLQQSDPVKSQ